MNCVGAEAAAEAAAAGGGAGGESAEAAGGDGPRGGGEGEAGGLPAGEGGGVTGLRGNGGIDDARAAAEESPTTPASALCGCCGRDDRPENIEPAQRSENVKPRKQHNLTKRQSCWS